MNLNLVIQVLAGIGVLALIGFAYYIYLLRDSQRIYEHSKKFGWPAPECWSISCVVKALKFSINSNGVLFPSELCDRTRLQCFLQLTTTPAMQGCNMDPGRKYYLNIKMGANCTNPNGCVFLLQTGVIYSGGHYTINGQRYKTDDSCQMIPE